MKKLAIMTILVAATGIASAADLGLRLGRNTGTETNNVGLTLGQRIAGLDTELAFDRSTVGTVNVNRFSVVGSYELAKVSNLTISAKAGAAFIDPSVGAAGYAGLVGVSASYPLTKTTSLVVDYGYQRGQDRVSNYNGNTVSAGIKVAF